MILEATFFCLYICSGERWNNLFFFFFSLSPTTLGGECGYVFGFDWLDLRNIDQTPILEHPTRMMEDKESASSSINTYILFPISHQE